MTDSISYALTLCDDSGKLIKGEFEYSLVDDKSSSAEKLKNHDVDSSDPTVTLSTFKIVGTIKLPEVTGQESTPVKGTAYVSLMGPTLANIVIANLDMKTLSMEYNFIDSAGEHIGGGLSWTSAPMQPAKAWGLIGKRIQG